MQRVTCVLNRACDVKGGCQVKMGDYHVKGVEPQCKDGGL